LSTLYVLRSWQATILFLKVKCNIYLYFYNPVFTLSNIYNLLWKILEFHLILFTLWLFSCYFIVALAFLCNVLIKKWSTRFQIPLIPLHMATNYIQKFIIMPFYYICIQPVTSQVASFCDVSQSKFWFSIPGMPN
jgi:hypothetical protein